MVSRHRRSRGCHKTRKKYTALSAGGQRRALLLACADNVPENRSVLNSFLEALQIWTIEEEMIIVGDCKIINLLMAEFICIENNEFPCFEANCHNI